MTRIPKLIAAAVGGALLGGAGFVVLSPHLARHLARPATVARTSCRPPARSPDDPLDPLVAALHRRFSDGRDVDFGFDRVSRPKVRVHFGPVMGHNDLLWRDGRSGATGYDPRWIRRAGRGYELRTEAGTWIPYGSARPQMRPETAPEREVLSSLLRSRRAIAIYTFGAFPPSGAPARANGPAYLGQLGPGAPDAASLGTAAAAAWRGERAALPGYLVRAEPVFAEPGCVKCHNDMDRPPRPGDGPRRPPYRAGDRIGLLLIAEAAPAPGG